METATQEATVPAELFTLYRVMFNGNPGFYMTATSEDDALAHVNRWYKGASVITVRPATYAETQELVVAVTGFKAPPYERRPDVSDGHATCVCCGYTVTQGSRLYDDGRCGYCYRNCSGAACSSPKRD